LGLNEAYTFIQRIPFSPIGEKVMSFCVHPLFTPFFLFATPFSTITMAKS
jgi:hypothetical protein